MHGLFHNIIWVGDLNYRLGDLEIEKLDKMMNNVIFLLSCSYLI